MLKLNNNKGSSIIEVLCSLSVFMIIFSFAFTILEKCIELNEYNFELYKYSSELETVKNNLQYNSGYDEIMGLETSDRYYISEDNLNIDKFKNSNICDLFTSDLPSHKPYVSIDIINGRVLTINLKLYFKISDKEERLECQTYKGDY